MLWGVFMVLKFDLKKFIISLAIPLLTGGLSALITRNNMDIYSKIVSPPLSPPAVVFPIVWTVLYALMGISLYLIWNSNNRHKNTAIILFFVQLFLNFIWSPIFFNNQWFLVSFIVLAFLWVATLLMIITFYNILKFAGLLQIPYLIWLTFAAYLNFAIYLLN